MVPTAAETLRTKAWLALTRNQTRDYLDIAALADHIGFDEAAAVLRVDSGQPLDSWPAEAIETPIDRGALSDWRRLVQAIRRRSPRRPMRWAASASSPPPTGPRGGGKEALSLWVRIVVVWGSR